jgi:hypothetical protein
VGKPGRFGDVRPWDLSTRTSILASWPGVDSESNAFHGRRFSGSPDPERFRRRRRGQRWLFRVRKNPEEPHFKHLLRHPPGHSFPSPGLLACRSRPVRRREGACPRCHAPKQAPGQVAPGQHQPLVPQMLDRLPVCLHQPFPQTRQRPDLHPLRAGGFVRANAPGSGDYLAGLSEPGLCHPWQRCGVPEDRPREVSSPASADTTAPGSP